MFIIREKGRCALCKSDKSPQHAKNMCRKCYHKTLRLLKKNELLKPVGNSKVKA